MLQKSPREERFGCLFGLFGGLIGIWCAIWRFSWYVDEMLAEDPHAHVCGTGLPPTMLGGFVVGGLLGALFGMILSHLMPLAGGKIDQTASEESTGFPSLRRLFVIVVLLLAVFAVIRFLYGRYVGAFDATL